MKIEYETRWRVYFIDALHQWAVAPPDGYYRGKQWVCLTNIHVTYWPTQKSAWNIALKNAKRTRTIAVMYFKYQNAVRLEHDYRARYYEAVQAT